MSHTHVHAVESAHLEAFVVRTRQLEERIAKIQMNVQQALVPQNLLRGLSMAMPFGCLYPRAFYGILRSSEAACRNSCVGGSLPGAVGGARQVVQPLMPSTFQCSSMSVERGREHCSVTTFAASAFTCTRHRSTEALSSEHMSHTGQEDEEASVQLR